MGDADYFDSSIPSSDGESKAADETQNGHQQACPLETAYHLADHEIMALPLEYGTKNPNRTDWQNERYTRDELKWVFGKAKGVGARWGYITGPEGEVLTNKRGDVDLDCLEAILAAPFYLPPTGMKWGRASKPSSHWVYALSSLDFPGPLAWTDQTPSDDVQEAARAGKKHKGQRLLELRVGGHSVAPGSYNTVDGHPELVDFTPDGHDAPAPVRAEDLYPTLQTLAGVALTARHWRDGDRHDAALPLAGFLCRGGMTEPDALRFMEAVCAASGDTEVENRLDAVHSTYQRATSGASYTAGRTLEEHFHPTTVAQLRKFLKLKPKQYVGLLGPDGYPLLGDGDGDRFADKWVGQVLYCAEEDRWYLWDGRRWAADRVKEIKERAKAVVYDFRRVLGEKQNSCGRDGVASYGECANHAKTMGSDANLVAMLHSAESKQELRITLDEFDANPNLLNTLDCTLELDPATGEAHEHLHDPGDRIRSLAPVHYRPGATHPLINDEFRRMFYPEDARWDFLWECGAEALRGVPKRHSLNLIGPTNAGKSMTLDLVSKTLGDYATTLHYSSLIKNPHRGGDTPRADLWRVRNARLITVSEVPPEVMLDVALYKAMLGGGDKMAVRNLFDKTGGMDVQWHASLWFSGNKPYGPPPGEEAAYERLLPLKCEHQVLPEKRDQERQLATLDVEETGAAVLNLLLDGFKRLHTEKRGRLVAPDFVEEARSELRDNLDHWTEIVEELFEFTGDDDHDGVLKSEAWTAAKDRRLDELGGGLNLPSHDKEKGKFHDSMTKGGRTREMRSKARFKNARMYYGVRWSAKALELARKRSWSCTLPDW